MGAPAAGAVVVLPFPFSDLAHAKLRPAVVLASVGKGDYILCQITSNPYADNSAIELTGLDFSDGGLSRTSYARPGKLFTANSSLFASAIGILAAEARTRIAEQIVHILRSGAVDDGNNP